VQGKPREDLPCTGFHDTPGTIGPALLLLVLVLVLGVWVPPEMENALREAAAYVETGR
jgi:F0F1-type ATP synthase membrane subunit b/b'